MEKIRINPVFPRYFFRSFAHFLSALSVNLILSVCREAAVHILLNIVRGTEPGQPRSLPVLPRELGSGR
jgi:hypothetical protein